MFRTVLGTPALNNHFYNLKTIVLLSLKANADSWSPSQFQQCFLIEWHFATQPVSSSSVQTSQLVVRKKSSVSLWKSPLVIPWMAQMAGQDRSEKSVFWNSTGMAQYLLPSGRAAVRSLPQFPLLISSADETVWGDH